MHALSEFQLTRLPLVWLTSLAILFLPFTSIAEIKPLTTIGQMAAAPRQVIPLSGIWQFKPGKGDDTVSQFSQKDIDHWGNIQVPANWYLQGHDISGIAWYAKRFSLPTQAMGKRVSLNFSGIDYTADIWLNGHYIGFHEGYFQAFQFDITDKVAFDKENQLIVKVNSPLEKMGEDWSLHKHYIKGIFGHHDTRPGGAWTDRAQEKNTGGIWAPVTLEIHEAAYITGIKVTPQLDMAHQAATADAQVRIDLQQATALPAKILVTLQPHNFASTQTVTQTFEQTLTPGLNTLRIPIALKNPELWWPWEQGKPNLYALKVQIINKQQVADAKIAVFGFRDVQYDKVHNQWNINGQRLFLRGTNYIATQWLSEMTPERFSYDIALMKAANINIVRVHAHVTAEVYYRLCDETGLLNWQDFPLQWGYVDDAAFHNNASKQAWEMVNGLFNHPSIVAWSMINEPAWEADWMKEKYKHVIPLQNKALTDKLYKAIAPLDPTRYVHPFSASSEHPWLGWYSGNLLDYNGTSQVSLVAEYGAQALPNLPDLRKILSEDNLWPETEAQWSVWEYHNFQRKTTFGIAKVPMGANPAEFVNNTQAYQAKAVKLAAEALRRQRYQPVSGIFQFMFVEDWPSMNWGVLDYWRTPKAGYFALQQAYQPVLPSIAWTQESYKKGEPAEFGLWIINDLHHTYPKAKIAYSLRSAEKLLETQKLEVNIAADSGRKIKDVHWPQLNPGHYELVFTITDSAGLILGVNSHEFDVIAP